jgi:ATP-dependent DNA helicase RecG
MSLVVEQKVVDSNEVARILALAESHFLDLKRVETAPAKLSESISAFANTAGGELFIGIGESIDRTKRSWRGFQTMEQANGLFQVLNGMTALGNYYSSNFLSCPGEPGFVLHLVIPKTRGILKATDGSAYTRHNAQNLRVASEEAMIRLRLDKGIVSFEDDVVNVALDSVTNSTTTLSFMLEVVPSAEPDDWMKKQNLIVNERPIVAGVLLYHDEPQAALPKRSAIKIYRYRTREQEGGRDQLVFDPITVEGPLYQQISDAVGRTKALIEGIQALTQDGLTPVVYPDETLHEILTNAVLHRDYSIPSDIHVRIFDNRIEVESLADWLAT